MKYAKLIVYLLLVVCVCSLASCFSNNNDFSSSIDTAFGPSEISEQSEIASNDAISDIPEAPDINAFPLPQLPDQSAEDLYNRKLELSYSSSPANADFLNILENMNQAELNMLYDRNNFFTIGHHLLYYTVNTPFGPSNIIIESTNGEIEEIFSSLNAISSLSITDNRKLIVGLVTMVHPDGSEVEYYDLNLSTGELSPILSYASTQDTLGYGITYYEDFFWITNASADFGTAYAIYKKTPGKFVPIVEQTSFFQFFAGSLYYLGKDQKTLYTCNLSGQNSMEIFQFEKEIFTFKIYKNKLLIYDMDLSIHLADIETKAITDLNIKSNYFNYEYLNDEGLYVIDKQNILNYYSYTEPPMQLLSNFQGKISTIKNGFIYFETKEVYNTMTFYRFWKIKEDGTLMEVINCPSL